MPIIITSTQIFKDEYNPGTTDVFQGNDGDKINIEIPFYFENTFDAGPFPSTQIKVREATLLNFPAQVGNAYIDLSDFIPNQTLVNELVGKEITIANVPTYNGTANVIGVNGDLIVLDVAYGADKSSNNGNFHVSSDITAAEFQYSYDRTNDNDFTGALSNGLFQKFLTDSSDVLDHTNTSPVSMIFGTVGSYQIGTCTIEGANLGITGRQGFIIKQELIIIPIEEGDNIDLAIDYTNAYKFRLIPKELPTSNPFQQGNNSNPFTSGSVVNGKINVGILDTNFGLSTNYFVSNVVIERTSDAKNSGIPIVEEEFTVSFDFENTVDSPFSDGNSLVQVGIENIPDILQSTTQGYIERFLWDRALTTLGSGAIGGESTGDAASITNYVTTFVDATKINVSFDVDFGANAESQINAQGTPLFTITCTSQDHTSTYVDTKRANITVFNGAGINKLLDAPVVIVSNNYVTHPFPLVTDGIDIPDGFPTQDLVAVTVFSIDWTGRPGLRLNRVIQSLVLKNSSTGEEIPLGDTIIPVNSFPLINNEYPDAGEFSQGTQFNINKGFKIPTDEIRNNAVMGNVNSSGPSPIFYFLAFPFFVRWEDYLQLIINPIPSDLIDTNKPFNGINHFLHRIDDVANWDIFYRLIMESAESGQNFVQTIDNQIITTDYNSHPEVNSRTISTFKEDKVTPLPLLNGNAAIESTEKTFIEVAWDMTSAPGSIGDFDIVFFMEVFQQGGPTLIQRISSVNDLLPSSWFDDTGAGDGKIEKAIDGTKAIGRAYIDNIKLQFADNYRIYPAIYSPVNTTESMLTELGEDMLTESGEVMKLE